MRQMKDSGVTWIGDIPNSWSVIRIKHLKNNEVNSFEDGDWIESPYISNDGIRYLTTGNIGDGLYKEQGDGYISLKVFKELNCKYAYPGDLVFSRLNAPYGRSCILPNDYPEYVLAVDNVILRTNHSKRFLCYVSQCHGYQRMVEEKANGTTMKRVSRTNLGDIPLPIPSQDEQEIIANYLDVKCADIDTLIAAKEKTNELLKEQRQSIIFEAVTKGLNSDAQMKDSGVEWIGEIPNEWDICKIKNCFNVFAGATPQSGNSEYWDGNIAWITPADYTTEQKYVNEGRKSITQLGFESCSTVMIPAGSLVFSKRAPIGLVAINTSTLCTNQGCLSCVPKDDNDVEYFYYAFTCFTEQFELYGSGTTFKEISADDFMNFRIPAPDPGVQRDISSYLRNRCKEIDAIIQANYTTVEKLKEYRQSIIYEAVTGKIEI